MKVTLHFECDLPDNVTPVEMDEIQARVARGFHDPDGPDLPARLVPAGRSYERGRS